MIEVLLVLAGFFLGLSVGLAIARYLVIKYVNEVLRELEKLVELGD